MTDIADRIASMRAGTDPDGAATPLTAVRKFFHPLEEAADEYVQWAQHPADRAYLGIPALDQVMRGIAPGELMLVVGYVHSGKTVVVTQIILNNPETRVVLFTPDETRVLVLIKLASIVHNMSAEDIEQAIAKGDTEVEDMVRDVARVHFPNLAVFDQSFDIGRMHACMDEVEDHWGGKAQMVIFDYADLLADGEDTKAKMGKFKFFGKDRKVPLVLLHQSSRTAGSDGAQVTIDSGGYGGEAQATFVLGVRRKKNQAAARIRDIEEKLAVQTNPNPRLDDMLEDARYLLKANENTVTLNLVKNKRPPARLVDDLDFHIDPLTGQITPLQGTMRSVGEMNQFGTQEEIFDEPF